MLIMRTQRWVELMRLISVCLYMYCSLCTEHNKFDVPMHTFVANTQIFMTEGGLVREICKMNKFEYTMSCT